MVLDMYFGIIEPRRLRLILSHYFEYITSAWIFPRPLLSPSFGSIDFSQQIALTLPSPSRSEPVVPGGAILNLTEVDDIDDIDMSLQNTLQGKQIILSHREASNTPAV